MTTNQNKKSLIFGLFCLISLITIMFILVPITFQNDTFYTIKVGERIMKEGLVPIDDFTFLDGLPYTYPHWLYDYLIYVIYQINGFKAIYLSTIVFSVLLGIIVFFTGYKVSGNRFVTFFVVFSTLIYLSLNYTARAQLITYILFVIEYGLLYFYAHNRINRLSFFIVMLFISLLIVNMHCATWLMFFLIALPFVFEKFFTHWIINKNYPISSRIINLNNVQYSARFILITLGCAILTGFLTPLGDTPFTYLIKTYQGISTSLISEHQPLVVIKDIPFIIFIIELIYVALFTRCKFYMSEILLLMGLTILALLSIRQTIILFLINSVIASRLLTQAFEESCPKRLAFYTKCIDSVKGMIVFFIILLIICCARTSLLNSETENNDDTNISVNKTNIKKYQSYDDIYPVKAMDYFRDNVDANTARIYTDYALGSYVIFRGYKPMIDSRADLYTIEFNHKYDYLEDIRRLSSFSLHYEDFFDRYNVNYILLSKDNGLFTYIKHDKLYPLVYEDEDFVIYKR